MISAASANVVLGKMLILSLREKIFCNGNKIVLREGA